MSDVSVKELSDDTMLHVARAARLMGICPGTLRNWIKRGDLPGYKYKGGSLRVKYGDVMKFIEAARVQVTV